MLKITKMYEICTKFCFVQNRQFVGKAIFIMNLKEVCLLLGKSESTLTDHFKRTQDTLRKKGILLSRWGRGKDVEYEIEYEELEEEE